ncbi:MAG: 16S rRNA processing protein RimM [Clostridia bacterium]|nr:16S rRNA processing protein RimM [Clostridia bacterium]
MLLSYLELGKIVSTHGVRGELRVQYWCDSPEFFKSFETVYLKKNGGEPMRVLGARQHGNVMLLTLEGIDDIDKANALRGKTIYVERAKAPLEPGSYFIAELIGCEVRDADSDKLYGTVKDVFNNGASDIWQIEGTDGKEYLLPSIPGVVVSTDVENNIALVRPMKGIFDEGEEIRED